MNDFPCKTSADEWNGVGDGDWGGGWGWSLMNEK